MTRLNDSVNMNGPQPLELPDGASPVRLPDLQLYPEGFAPPHLADIRKPVAHSKAGDAASPADAEQVESSGAGV